tara:strand:- start:66 stop:302 length:237 start_codon:yes stop_codon:yes gene_type:complete
MFLDYEEQDTYERAVIGFIQVSSRRGLNPKLTEIDDKLVISFRYKGLNIEHTTKKKDFVKTDKIALLDLLTNKGADNE